MSLELLLPREEVDSVAGCLSVVERPAKRGERERRGVDEERREVSKPQMTSKTPKYLRDFSSSEPRGGFCGSFETELPTS